MSEQTPERTTLTINWAQIAGGALAAVTSAFLLAGLKSLGSYGTLVGAAMGSVIASTAAAIYGHYLNASRARLAEAARRARGRTPGPSPVPPAQDEHPDDPAPPASGGNPSPAPSPVPPPRKRFRPAHAVVLGVLAFVLSVGGIFAFEQLSGRSVAAERQGSTATVNPGIVGNEITSTPSTPTPSETASPTQTATSTDTATSAATATDSPTSSATATNEPTGKSTATSTATSSASSSSPGATASSDPTVEQDGATAPTADSSDAALTQATGVPTTSPTAG